MRESNEDNIFDLGEKDSNDINTQSDIDNTIDENVSEISDIPPNDPEELLGVPQSILNYLKKKNCSIVSLGSKDHKLTYKQVKAAFLKKTDNVRAKDFNFQFKESEDYYFFITKEHNKNYLKPITSSDNQKKRKIKNKRESKDKESDKSGKIENKNINLNFDYNKYVLKGIVAKIKKSGPLEIFCEVILNREICQVSHTTSDSIQYYKNTKTIKPPNSKRDFESFALLIPEKYYIIEIETKKPAIDTIIKEDGITSVLYIMTPRKRVIVDLFTMVKYSLYFIKETLYNYIGKYIHDMIYDFCHLPSECFDDFLSHIGSLTKIKNSYKLHFPLRRYIKLMESLSQKNLINHIFRNLPNISRQKASDRVPFHKFILMYEKYKLYYAEKEFKIKDKILDPKKNPKYSFLKQSTVIDPVNDRITKEHKVNLNLLIKSYFEILEKFLKENLSQDKNVIRNFLTENLCKFLTQYTSFKGFFNLDIVINEDNMFEFQCTKNKTCNKKINNNMFGCVVNTLACINYFFGFNEGFFHKHFSIMDYSYNFNEKNVIHTFLCINDSSKKNKIRIYDIPFMEKWNYQIAGLLLMIYRDKFGFLCNKNYIKNQKKEIDFHSRFGKLFNEIHQNVFKDVEEYYINVLPDYYYFCSKVSMSPLDKYNCLDNLCQNFANDSLKYLMGNNIMFFSPFSVIYDIETKKELNYPNLNTVLEPYLILVDNQLKEYLDMKEKKEKYLEEKNITIKSFFDDLKLINIEKTHYSVFISEKKDSKILDDDEDEDKKENSEINTSTNHDEEDHDNENNDKSEIENENENEIIENKISDIPEESKINVDEIYPKKFFSITLKPPSNLGIPNEEFNFYFYFNLYYNYIYTTMKEMKAKFIDYDIIKKYIASIESSITISFNDYDKTIIKNNKKDSIGDIKQIKKHTKKEIIKKLTIMNKLTRLTRHMNYIFSQYVNKIVNKIIKDPTTKISMRNSQKEKYYIKVGHYIVNFSAYEKDKVFFNEFDYYKKSDICKKLEDDKFYLDALDITQ